MQCKKLSLLKKKTANVEKKNRGLFITFEGGEGVGKTTLISSIYKELISKEFLVTKTHAPGGTELGKHLRDLLLHSKEFHIFKKTELFLFMADRAQHVNEIIRPALKSNHIVLCDRFNDSTLAYQSAEKAFSQKDLQFFCLFATTGLVPDLTFFLDLPSKIGLKRAMERKNDQEDRIQDKEIEFHENVRTSYLDIIKQDPSRFHILDAKASLKEIFQAAMEAINKKISSSICMSQ